MNEERNTKNFEIRSQEEGIVSAYLTKFGTVDDYKSTFLRGAFAESFKNVSKIRLLFDHRQLAGKVLEAKEDDYGPLVRVKFNLDTVSGREAFSHVRHGDITNFSFGFKTKKDSWVGGIRKIEQVELLEVSPVLFPANPDAKITDFRDTKGDNKMGDEKTKKKDEKPEQKKDVETRDQPVTLEQIDERIRKTWEAFKAEDEKKGRQETRSGNPDPVTVETLEKINSAITELRKKQSELEKIANRPGIPAEYRDKKNPEAEFRLAAWEKFCRHGYEALPDMERRVLSNVTDVEGGFLTPPQWEASIISYAYDQAEVRPQCFRGTTGRDMVQLAEIGKIDGGWGYLNVAPTAETMTTGVSRIQIYDLVALAKIHKNTLDDGQANIEQEIVNQIGMRFAELEDDAFIGGSGANQPGGIITNTKVKARAEKTGVSDNIVDASHNGFDALIEVVYSLNKKYRRNGVWAMNSTTEGKVRQLKNVDDGTYIWQPGGKDGSPATLLGYPIINPEDMDDIGTNKFPILFGSFQAGYKIYDRQGVVLQRLVELYAATGQVGFKATKRVGGEVALYEAFTPLKCAA